MSKIKLFEMI